MAKIEPVTFCTAALDVASWDRSGYGYECRMNDGSLWRTTSQVWHDRPCLWWADSPMDGSFLIPVEQHSADQEDRAPSKVRFTKIRLELAMSRQAQTVDALAFGGGLFAIHKEVGTRSDRAWRLTHVRTGLGIAGHQLYGLMKKQAGAKLVAAKLVESLGPDLSRFDTPELNSNLQLLDELKNFVLAVKR